METGPQQLRDRTKRFAYRVVKLFRSLPRTPEAQIVGKQLFRSATSVAANYRAACNARSKPEFIAKIGVVVEEADESVFWLELMGDNEIVPVKRLAGLIQEARELTAIMAASQRTARAKDKTSSMAESLNSK
jgi:four helix bundle protein